MGAEDDTKYLESERKKLWEELSQLKKQFEEVAKLKEQIQKQTPEQIQLIVNKAAEIDALYLKINSIYEVVIGNNETINTSLQTINTKLLKSNEDTNKIEQLNKKSEVFSQAIEESKTKIDGLLLNSTQTNKDLDTIIAEIATKSQKLQEIDLLNEASEKLKEKIDLAYTNIDKHYKEINSLHLKIFGYMKKDDKGDELKVKGLKDELDQSYSQLTLELTELHKEINTSIGESKDACKNVKIHWEEIHESLEKQITCLLPGALTAGLSHAYKEKKDHELESMKLLNESFQKAIYGLICQPYFILRTQ